MRDVVVEIDALTIGGAGIGRLDGKAVFVPLSAPGDRVLCRIMRDKKRYCEAEILEVLSPSSERQAPLCPHFGRCGGCQWQHLPDELQGHWKQRLFADLLSRQAGVPESARAPLLRAPSAWGYRSRAQIKCRMTPEGFLMGFYRRATHDVIDIKGCPVLDNRLNAAWTLLREALGGGCDPAGIFQVDLGVGDAGAIRALIHYEGSRSSELAAGLRQFGLQAGISLFLLEGRKAMLHLCGERDLYLELEGLRLGYGPGGFSQINLQQNRALVDLAIGALPVAQSYRVLDLFCGMGNFSLPLARRGAKVVGVEDFAPSIRSARINASNNALSGLDFFAESAEGALLRRGGTSGFDAVLLDPPRSGAAAVVPELLQGAPKRIIYVSCDPATLARDLKPLLAGGYRVEWARPVDMFPQTHHIESVTRIDK